MENIIYTTADNNFRVIQRGTTFIPQQKLLRGEWVGFAGTEVGSSKTYSRKHFAIKLVEKYAAEVQEQEEIQHEALAVEEVQEVAVENRQEQAENYIIEMDMVEAELQQATTYELFASCKAELEALKSDIEALGYEVKRVPTGWMLVEPVVAEVAQAASPLTVELHEDEQGLYAEVPSSKGKTAYTVRVCAKWLYTVSCDCAARGDCRHRVQVDRALDTVRPTFSEQVKGVTTSQEVIARLVTPDRYSKPLKGSGVTGFRHAEIARKLAA